MAQAGASVIAALEAALRAPVDERDRAVDRAVMDLAAARPDAIPADVPARRAFWINAYNVLTLHSVRDRGASIAAAWHRCAFARYHAAGRSFTLDDIEHGLLRSNARPPYRVKRPFGERDPRLMWAVPLDGRVHFALNCGAVSCPPVRVYDGARLDEQLAVAETAFLSSETQIDDGARTITTSKLLDFYTDDFGGVDAARERIEQACGRPAQSLAGYRLAFSRYDWTAQIRFAVDATPPAA
jgi:hypothetical protein